MILRNLLNNLEDWGYVPGPFQFNNLHQLLNNQVCEDYSVHIFEKVNDWQLKMVNVHH